MPADPTTQETGRRERAEAHAKGQFGENVDQGHVDRMAAGLAIQDELIAGIRGHLTDAENAAVDDKLIWQRAVRFGPLTVEQHAVGLRAAMRAADEYVTELEQAMAEEAPDGD